MRIKSTVVFDGEKTISNRQYYYTPKINDIIAHINDEYCTQNNEKPFPVVAKGKHTNCNISLYKIPKSSLDKGEQDQDYYTCYISKDYIEKDIKSLIPTYGFCESDLFAINYYDCCEYSCRKYALPTYGQLQEYCLNYYIKEQDFTASCIKDLPALKEKIEKIISASSAEIYIKKTVNRCGDEENFLMFVFNGAETRIKELKYNHLENIKHIGLKVEYEK